MADPPGGGGKSKPVISPMAQVYDPGGGTPTSTRTDATFFYCDNQSRDPHNSTHQSGVVNAEGYIWCSDPTVPVTLHSTLYKEFAWLWWASLDDSGVVAGTGTMSVFVNYPCQGNLNYRIVTDHTAEGTFPNPVTTSNTQYVACQP